MLPFIIAIFLSAFLLFQVQPLIARYILPWFGGVSAVWSTVQMFFQVLLTAGYAYANWLGRDDSGREHYHRRLLLFSIGLLLFLGWLWRSPITPSAGWKPSPEAQPVLEILKLLTFSVGLPYFLLASNSPLIQAWFYRQFPQRTTYALYAFSNLGSLLGLITYPLLVEPFLSLQQQGWLWSFLYLVYAGLVTILTFSAAKRSSLPAQRHSETITAPSLKDGMLWVFLAAIASLFLLVTTAQITQEIAVVPFLWVLPLTIYLLSFILTFSGERWYARGLFSALLLLSMALVLWALIERATMPLLLQIAIYALTLFAVAMICHGELYRLRPHPIHLTRFYLLVSVGGAMGGIFATLIAPLLFRGFWEYPIALTLTWLMLLLFFLQRTKTTPRLGWLSQLLILALGLGLSVTVTYQFIYTDLSRSLLLARNFYGIVRVTSLDPPEVAPARYALVHGATVHGFQYLDPALRTLPTAYFAETSGIGLAIAHHPQRGRGMRIGVLGLGIGTIAAYGQEGDVYRFYEINPDVIELANGKGGYFSYLSQSQAHIEIVPGDARLSLERELRNGERQHYDLLVLDVFTGDSPPVHLLNREAFALYLEHLDANGMLAIHITNRHLELWPVVAKLAEHFNLSVLLIEDSGDGERIFASRWALLARDVTSFAPPITARATPTEVTSLLRLWTDDYSNLLQILKR